jgi:FkbH-like protein
MSEPASSHAAVTDLPAPVALALPLSIAILRNYTIEAMVPLLKVEAERTGLTAVVTVGGYDTVRQEILDETSPLHAAQPDLVVLSLMLEYLAPESAATDWDASEVRAFMRGALADLIARTQATIIVTTLVAPLHVEDSFGAARQSAHRITRMEDVNDDIRQIAREHPSRVFVVDSGRIVQRLGEGKAFDHRFGYMYRAPLAKDFLHALAREVVTVGRLLKGRIKKCLVLDCDNTLWGGVIGEDGLAGIALDPHDFPGRCYRDFQRSVLNLAAEGVVVALCSKNEEADVWAVLDQHPHGLLKRSHLAAWRINWRSKAENIAELARELNIGLDSVVFVDDSALECDLVRSQLPDVTVLQVPARPYDLPPLLYRNGWFTRLSGTTEDARRTDMYREAVARTAAQQTFTDHRAYLESLGLRADVSRVSASTLSRVAQLVAKTNQFNLTTRRHSEEQLARLAHGDDTAVFALSAQDKFGDLGLVGVLIARREGDSAHVDSLLLSCRALGRDLEVAFVDRCLDSLERLWSVSEWTAEYRPTPKNLQVARFWDRLGFASIATEGGVVTYRLPAPQRGKPSVEFIALTGVGS